MRIPDSGYVSTILATTEGPCVSIYLPIRGNGTGEADRVQFRNLAHEAEMAFAKSNPAVARGLVGRFQQLAGDDGFWGEALDSVVVLASGDRFDTLTLPRVVPERVEVGDSFHVKPLLRFVQPDPAPRRW